MSTDSTLDPPENEIDSAAHEHLSLTHRDPSIGSRPGLNPTTEVPTAVAPRRSPGVPVTWCQLRTPGPGPFSFSLLVPM